MPANFWSSAWKADALPLGDSGMRTPFYHNQNTSSVSGVLSLAWHGVCQNPELLLQGIKNNRQGAICALAVMIVMKQSD
jgi:hypothetical protein